MTESEAYEELTAYTLERRDAEFIHQHVVDAYIAQHADANTKPIALAFALVGLYLHVEKNVSGRDVQRVHMKLARHKRTRPTFPLPPHRGSMTVLDVIAASPGPAPDAAIHGWAAGVWEAFRDQRDVVSAM